MDEENSSSNNQDSTENCLPTSLEESLANLKIVAPYFRVDDQDRDEDFLARDIITTPNSLLSEEGGEETEAGGDTSSAELDIEPADPWDDVDEDPLTEEELINVLRSFEHDEDDTDSEIVEFPAGEALPELDIEADDSMFLSPEEFTASIFDPQPTTGTTTTSNSEESELDKDDEFETTGNATLGNNNIDDELGLLEGLQNLNLNWQPEDDDIIPSYLYCQPCTPFGKSSSDPSPTNFSLASIAEDKALLDQSTAVAFRQFLERERPKLPEQEFDTLLQLSLMNFEDGDHTYLHEGEIMDSVLEVPGAYQEDAENSQLPPSQQKHQDEEQEQQPPFNVSERPEALHAASEIMSSFVAKTSGLQNERSCIGHKETIFGTSFSECGKYLATASQDSTVRIWDVATNSLLTTLREHSTEYECLRVAWASSKWGKDTLDRGGDSIHSSLLATGGADGAVKIWTNKDPSQKDSWLCCATLDHTEFDRVPANPDDDADKPQVYALQWIDHWSGLPIASEQGTQNSFLLTSSDDFIHLWEVDTTAPTEPQEDTTKLCFREVLSLHFASFHNHGYGVSVCQVTNSGLGLQNSPGHPHKDNSSFLAQKAFGGDRNPNNIIFVFDADYCPANGLLGVALSDGSLRLMNGRGVCISIMQLPGCQSHLTSFSWDSTGTRLATCVATGHVILWGMDVHDNMGSLTTTCTAILEGGHQPGRPVFGSRYCAAGENLLLTWGVDGRLCLWDSYSQGNIHAPIATLVQNADYPIYAVDVQCSCLVVGGGGGEASFLGVPVLLYDTKKEKKANRDSI